MGMKESKKSDGQTAPHEDLFRPLDLQLYLECYSRKASYSPGQLRVPLSTAIVETVLIYCRRRKTKADDILQGFYVESRASDKEEVTVNLMPQSEFRLTTAVDLEWHNVFLCTLPALYVPSLQLHITGLCSVVRYIVKTLDASSPLLGFQGGCLSAPAEVSTWTRFCEVEMPSAARLIWRGLTEKSGVETSPPSKAFELPIAFAKFEVHLRQPIRMHNIRKRMQQDSRVLKIASNGKDPIHQFASTHHIFAEGPDCMLSDLMLVPSFYASFQYLGCDASSMGGLEELDSILGSVIPLTVEWFKRMMSMEIVDSFRIHFSQSRRNRAPFWSDLITLPNCSDESLYKSDPKRRNPTARVFTRQQKVDKVLADLPPVLRVANLGEKERERKTTVIKWDDMPALVDPLHGGHLPPSRYLKKCQQLESMVEAVLHLVKERKLSSCLDEGGFLNIVDFCSGGGHLGILLAHLLPDCLIFMVENKPESLERAISRVQRLGLINCRFYQGNLDYFCRDFDIGVSLHACGVATDLVINLCVSKKADFVCCPCCYGSVQENHVLTYPRSKIFEENGVTTEKYMVMGHTADQTHVSNSKHQQGELAMDIIDSDRVHLALENGYSEVRLSKLRPVSCSPKNNLIVAKL